MDVWSLFVTVVSLMAPVNFDEEMLATGSYSNTLAFVRVAAANILPDLQPVARENPELRASAAQILIMYFNGKGSTTRQSEVGFTPEVPAPTAI